MPVEPVVADHPAPQRVVEVEHQAFPGLAAGGGDQPRRELAVGRGRLGGDLHLGLQPAHLVEPGVEPVAGAGPRRVEPEHARRARGVGEGGVQPGGQPRRRARHHRVEPAEQRRRHVQERLLQHRRAQGLRAPPQRPEVAHRGVDRRAGLRGGGGERNRAEEVPGAEREEHGVGPEAVERRGRVRELLPVLAVGPGMGGDAQAAPQPRHPDRGQQVIHGARREQRQPDRLEPARPPRRACGRGPRRAAGSRGRRAGRRRGARAPPGAPARPRRRRRRRGARETLAARAASS